MKNKLIYRVSIILNGIFIVIFLLIGLKYKEKILENLIIKEKEKIVMFGDSIIKGGKWNYLLNRNDIKNSGFGGVTTSHFISLIHNNVIDHNPEFCFIQGGINDIGLGVSFSRTKNNYKSLIDTLIANKITPIVQSTLYQENNFESKILVDSLNNFLIGYCTDRQIYYLDINSKLSTTSGLKSEYSRDGTHITENAYEIWSQEINILLDKIESTGTNNVY